VARGCAAHEREHLWRHVVAHARADGRRAGLAPGDTVSRARDRWAGNPSYRGRWRLCDISRSHLRGPDPGHHQPARRAGADHRPRSAADLRDGRALAGGNAGEPRGNGDVAQLGDERCGRGFDRARHVQLVGRCGDRLVAYAHPVGRARWTASLRYRQDAQRGRLLSGAGTTVFRWPRPARLWSRASRAQRNRTHRTGVDVLGRADGAAVKVYFHTFGCKANQYDTERVRQAFDDSGGVAVDDPALADIAVVNSCTVTSESEVKLRRFVRPLANADHAPTIVMGCAAALDDGTIAALPSVRAVVANADPVTGL